MRLIALAGALAVPVIAASPAHALYFTPGDLVVSLVGNVNGVGPTTYYNAAQFAADGSYDNQATPILLDELTPTGQLAGSLTLPQTASGANFAISGEYGSSSEGYLHSAANGQSLVIGGYGVNAQTYNAADTGAAKNGVASNPTYGDARLAQSNSLSPAPARITAVPRVVADINAAGTVNTATAVYNFANGNNIRSVATVDGSNFYIAGQGQKGDTTQGVFNVQAGATTTAPTIIDDSTDFRSVTIQNGQVYASRDSTQGMGGTTQIDTFRTPLPTSATAATDIPGFPQTVTVTAQNENGANNSRIGKSVDLSPEDYVFVTYGGQQYLYVADSGNPKGGNVGTSQLGDGGVQKWELVGGTWSEIYDISAGLGILANATGSTSNADGTSGAIGLAVGVVNGVADIFATNATLGDLDQTYLFTATDPVAQTSLGAIAGSDAFTTIFTAPAGTNVRGVAFAPVPEPASLALLAGALGVGALVRRRKRQA